MKRSVNRRKKLFLFFIMKLSIEKQRRLKHTLEWQGDLTGQTSGDDACDTDAAVRASEGKKRKKNKKKN